MLLEVSISLTFFEIRKFPLLSYGIKSSHFFPLFTLKVLLENNLDNLTMWLVEIGEQSPEKAFNMMLKLSEFVVPKLARKELSGVDGASLFSAVQFKFGDTIEE